MSETVWSPTAFRRTRVTRHKTQKCKRLKNKNTVRSRRVDDCYRCPVIYFYVRGILKISVISPVTTVGFRFVPRTRTIHIRTRQYGTNYTPDWLCKKTRAGFTIKRRRKRFASYYRETGLFMVRRKFRLML